MALDVNIDVVQNLETVEIQVISEVNSITINPVVERTSVNNAAEKFISGFYFNTQGNTDVNAIEVGNTFRGWPTADRYVVGKVLALPFDVNDETKVQLYIDN
jgi:hypothetical protein